MAGSGAPAGAVAAILSRLLPADLVGLFDTSFVRSHARYDEFVHRQVLGVFRETALGDAVQTGGDVGALVTRAGLDPDHALVPVAWMLRHLAARRLLLGADGRFRALVPLPALDPAPFLDEQRREDPSWLPSYVLAETVARDYPSFLRGEATGEQVLFSPARLQLWLDYFSNDNRLYAVNNRVGAVAALAWAAPGALRVLELGGGLASGAAALLERVAVTGRLADLREYRFTELVPAFLRRGERSLRTRFPDVPLTCTGLDMNRRFVDQGVAAQSVNLAYAVNTLHVAHDLPATLGEIFRALEPGGRLVVSECVRPWPGQPVYAEFVFNLMATFRSPKLEAGYRPNGGFLTPEQWAGALETAGFEDVAVLPDIARIREELPDFYVAAVGATRPA